MKYYFVFFVLLSGCAIFNQFDEIVQKPVAEWSKEDCLSILMSAVSHNLYREDTRIRIIVTPFSPLVITAFSRLEQYKKQSPNEQFSKVLEERLLEDVGLYFDTNGIVFKLLFAALDAIMIDEVRDLIIKQRHYMN